MSNQIAPFQMMPTKKDLFTFVELFDSVNTKFSKEIPEFKEAFISFYGEGCFDKEQALYFIDNLKEDDIPQSFCYAVLLQDEDCVISVYIGRDQKGERWVLEHDNMMPVKDFYADTIEDAYVKLKNSIIEYISI